MALIDHLVYVVAELADGVDDLADRLGTRAAPGGSHPGRGTHNALVGLDGSYLEIIAPDPDQPEPAGGRPFGVSTGSRAHLATFAVRPGPGERLEDLVDACRHAGHDPGPVSEMSRAAPDGSVLRWRLTMPTSPGDVGIVPFLIDWGETAHPADSAPSAGRLLRVSASTATPDETNRVLAALGLDVVATPGPRSLSAEIQTPDRVVDL